MKKVVLAFDSFKGSVSSKEITQTLQRAISSEWEDIDVVSFPIADGGEGTVEILADTLGAEFVCCTAHDPLMRPIKASYAIVYDQHLAIIEMASAAGLPLLSEKERNPMFTSTYGVGEIVLDAVQKGCTHILLGLGGSATNDAGTGMLAAMGVSFLDKEGKSVDPCGKTLKSIEKIDTTSMFPSLKNISFTVICDVDNPFYGKNGAAYVYAPQKGASTDEVKELDEGLCHYRKLILRQFGKDINLQAGVGAAGGMAGGLLPFLNVKLMPGSQTVLRLLGFENVIKEASLVITGEGKVDRQTCMGKALQGILDLSKKYQVPVVAIGGAVESVDELNKRGFTAVFSIQSGPVNLETSMNKEYTLAHLSQTVNQILRLFFN
jgi:glycerate kinase